MKNIILYTEDIPVKDGVVSTGLSRVNSYFIQKLSGKHVFSFFFNKSIRKHFSIYDQVENSTLSKSNIVSHGCFFKIISFIRFVFVKALKCNIDDYFLFVLSKAIKQGQVVSCSNDAIVFAPIGVDYSAIGRAKLLADTINVPLAIYLVDDPVANMRILQHEDSVITCANNQLGQLLKVVDYIFVISEGLKNSLKIRYGVDSKIMSLPYIEKKTPELSCDYRTKFGEYIVFVGNSSHFYQDGLEDLLVILSEKITKRVKLIFTIPSSYVCFLEKKYPGIVFINICNNESDLASLVNQASASFLPYSFSSKYVDMVSTSFPSKFLDYCSWSKKVIIYAPNYSVSAQLACHYNLPYTVTINDNNHLAAAVELALNDENDYSSAYFTYLKKNHINFNFASAIACGI